MILERNILAAEYAGTYMYTCFLHFVFLVGKIGGVLRMERQHFCRSRTYFVYTIRARPLLKPLSL